jgi:hypothetical protein
MKLPNKNKKLAFEFQKIILSRAINAICKATDLSREQVFEWLIDGERWDGVKYKLGPTEVVEKKD